MPFSGALLWEDIGDVEGPEAEEQFPQSLKEELKDLGLGGRVDIHPGNGPHLFRHPPCICGVPRSAQLPAQTLRMVSAAGEMH